MAGLGFSLAGKRNKHIIRAAPSQARFNTAAPGGLAALCRCPSSSQESTSLLGGVSRGVSSSLTDASHIFIFILYFITVILHGFNIQHAAGVELWLRSGVCCAVLHNAAEQTTFPLLLQDGSYGAPAPRSGGR